MSHIDEVTQQAWEQYVNENLHEAAARRDAIRQLEPIVRRARDAAIQAILASGKPVKLARAPGLEYFPLELQLWPL